MNSNVLTKIDQSTNKNEAHQWTWTDLELTDFAVVNRIVDDLPLALEQARVAWANRDSETFKLMLFTIRGIASNIQAERIMLVVDKLDEQLASAPIREQMLLLDDLEFTSLHLVIALKKIYCSSVGP